MITQKQIHRISSVKKNGKISRNIGVNYVDYVHTNLGV